MRVRHARLIPSKLLVIVALAAAACLGTVRQAAAQAQDSHTRPLAAFVDSLKLVSVEHAIRIGFQQKTRDELGGPFWSDYGRSVRIPHQWEDGDAWWVNYLGHPIHGAAAGYVWAAHDPKTTSSDIGLNRQYWATRWRPLAWMTVYSLQFEFGPLSEASIGNVGLRPDTTGWVDHVVTPVAGLGLMIAEDALDQFFLRWFEARVHNRAYRASMRMIFNPGRTLGNLATGDAPWAREGRPLRAR